MGKVQGAANEAPVDGDFPGFSVVDLAQAGKQDGIEGGLGGLGISEALVLDDAVHQGCPPHEAGTGDGEVSPGSELFFSRLMELLVEVDAAVDAGAHAAVDDGQLPVLLVVNLVAADKHGASHSEVFQGGGLLVGEASEECLEAEQGRGVPDVGLGGVCVGLREGVPLELVVPVLCVEGEDRKKQADGYDEVLSHRWSRA